MIKEYNFLYLTEAINAGDLGRIFGAIKQSVESIFGRKSQVFNAMRDYIMIKGARGGWSQEVIGPRSPIMRDLQVFTQSMKKLRDNGFATQAQLAEQKILDIIENASKSATETTGSLSEKIAALTEEIMNSAVRKGRVSSGSLRRGLAKAEKSYGNVAKTYSGNVAQIQSLPAEMKQVADTAVSRLQTPKNGLSSEAIRATIAKQTEQLRRTADPAKQRVIKANIKASEARLAKAEAIEKLNATAATKPAVADTALEKVSGEKLDPAIDDYMTAKDALQGRIDFAANEEAMERAARRQGIINWLRSVKNRIKNRIVGQ